MAYKKLLFRTYKVLPNRARFFISYNLSHKFVVGIIAFVIKDNEILLIKNSYQSKWGLPGGWLKQGEQISECIERELEEELGLKVKMEKIFEVKSMKSKPVLDIAVVCKTQKTELIPDNKEVEEAQFFNMNSLPQDILFTQKPYLDEFLKSYKT